jgi:hypothetical protein
MGRFAWLATLILLPAAGAPLLSRPTFRRFAPLARIGLSAGAGAVLISFVMTAFALAGVAWRWMPVVAAAALLAWALTPLVGNQAAAPPPPEPAGRAGAMATVLSAASIFAALAATAAGAATSIDFFFFWGPKAQQFAVARGVDVAFLADPSHGYMHAYYPPLVTNLDALASLAAGRFSWTSAALTFPLLLAALAAALPGVLRLAAPRPAAAAASALAVGAIAVIGIRAGIAGNGDMPLYFFETLAIALLLRRDSADAAVQLLAGLLLAGAAASKVEGLVFVFAASALFLLVRRGGAAASGQAAARLAVPAAVSLGAWFAFGITRHLFHDYSEYGRFFDVHAEQLPRAAAAVIGALGGAARGLPYLVPLACLLAAGRPTRAALLPLGTAGALVLFFLFTYLHLPDPSDWISWSAARVFLPAAVLVALAPCAALPGQAPDTGEPPPH